MRTRSYLDLLRPVPSHPGLATLVSDYPVPLLTRRAFGVIHESVWPHRSSAPRHIALRPFRPPA